MIRYWRPSSNAAYSQHHSEWQLFGLSLKMVIHNCIPFELLWYLRHWEQHKFSHWQLN
jgi:hypothetical protein